MNGTTNGDSYSSEVRVEVDANRIARILSYLISKKMDVTVKGKAGEILGRFRLLNMIAPAIDLKPSDAYDGRGKVVLEAALPDVNKDLVNGSSEVRVEIVSGGTCVFFDSLYLRVVSLGFRSEIEIDFPQKLSIVEGRKSPREEPKIPEFVSVEVKSGSDNNNNGQIYTFRVVNTSEQGLGVLIPGEVHDFINRIKPGDVLSGITLYARDSLITVDVRVVHITQIKGGREKGSYMLGLESKELVDSSRTPV